jgi:glycogen(starch) synthase
MKVLIIGDYPPPYGGSSVQVSTLHRLLAATPGFTCRVLDVGTTRRQRRPECLPARHPLEFAWQLLAHAARGYVLHLHTNGHNIKSWLMTLVCAAAGMLNGRQTLVSIGSGLAPDFVQQSAGSKRLVIRAALLMMGAIIGRNERMRSAIIGLGIPGEKIAIVPGFYGVRTVERAVIAKPIEEFLRDHSPVLAAMASRGPEYGIPLFLEATRRLRPQYPGLGVLLIGPERFHDEGLDGALLAAGELPHDVVLALLAKVTLFVRPTDFDGDASSVREALALGVPVVASDTDFRPEGVALFRRGDVADLADRIAEVLRGGPPAGAPGPAASGSLARVLAIYERLGRGSRSGREDPDHGGQALMLVSALRPWPGALEPLWWAVKALRAELWGFRFDFPIETVRAAGPRDSLHYYVYSDRLFFDVMELDAQGIPRQRHWAYGEGYNPAYVPWYGLMSLERHLRGLDPAGGQTFLKQVEWLVAHGVRRDDGAIVWHYPVDWWEGACLLKAPWISAMAQGLAISALVRGYRITGDQRLLDVACAATRVFETNVEDGGVRTLEDGHPLYEEYPGYPLARVLDGFLFSLLGLYDLAVETDDRAVFDLFAHGVDGLRHRLPFWDYRGRWSWYGSHGYLCLPHYNKLNGALLATLARLSGDSMLQQYAERWDPRRLSVRGRAEVFVVFVLTKNRSRLRRYLRGRWGPGRSASALSRSFAGLRLPSR